MAGWRIRAARQDIDVKKRYSGHSNLFSIRLHHGGEFRNFPREYVNGRVNYVDLVDIENFSIHDIDELMEYYQHVEEGKMLFYHFLLPLTSLDTGLYALAGDQDVCHLAEIIPMHKLIDVYIEHGKSVLRTYLVSPNPSRVRIEEINDPPPPPRCSRRLFLGWHDTETMVGSSSMDQQEVIVTEQSKDKGDNDVDVEIEDDNDDEENDESEDEDSDFIVDEENLIGDVDVNMDDFFENIDFGEEWVGDTSQNVRVENPQGEEEAVEVLNNDELVSGSSSDEGESNTRKKSIRQIQRALENENALVSEPFYLFQTFSSAEEVKEKVKEHAIETRRELTFAKNDKTRLRVICKGSNPTLVPGQKKVENEFTCPWVLLVSKGKRDTDWMVKTYKKTHKCLKTRKVKACTYHFLAKKILHQVEVNPEVPVRALQEELSRTYGVTISEMKAYRAKEKALKQIQGDYGSQYALLRDYGMELQKRNPDTTIKIEVENECNPSSETRIFKRIYICIGALKRGFAAGKRKKSAMELEDLVRGGTISRAQKSVTCSKCGNSGHNARSCKGQPSGRGRGGMGTRSGMGRGAGMETWFGL